MLYITVTNRIGKRIIPLSAIREITESGEGSSVEYTESPIHNPAHLYVNESLEQIATQLANQQRRLGGQFNGK